MTMAFDNSPVTPPEEAKSRCCFLSGTLRYLAEKVGANLRELGKRAKCVSVKVKWGTVIRGLKTSFNRS